jgi:hypothetical protein
MMEVAVASLLAAWVPLCLGVVDREMACMKLSIFFEFATVADKVLRPMWQNMKSSKCRSND